MHCSTVVYTVYMIDDSNSYAVINSIYSTSFNWLSDRYINYVYKSWSLNKMYIIHNLFGRFILY